MFYQFPGHVNAGIAANVRISVGVFLRNETYCSKVCIQVWLVVLSNSLMKCSLETPNKLEKINELCTYLFSEVKLTGLS